MLAQPPHPNGDRGWVINMASILGTVGFVGGSEYTAAKGGAVNLVCLIGEPSTLPAENDY